MYLDVVGEGLGHEWQSILEPGEEPVEQAQIWNTDSLQQTLIPCTTRTHMTPSEAADKLNIE